MDELRRELERAESDFDQTEALYFQRAATVEALRQAWARRDEARRKYNKACAAKMYLESLPDNPGETKFARGLFQ